MTAVYIILGILLFFFLLFCLLRNSFLLLCFFLLLLHPKLVKHQPDHTAKHIKCRKHKKKHP